MVYKQDEERSLFLAAEQWNEAFFVFVNLFHARHVREQILEYALHETGLRTQTKRRSTGQQPGTKSGFRPVGNPDVHLWFCLPIDLNRISLIRSSEKIDQDRFVRCSRGGEGRLSPGRTNPSALRPAWLRRAPP